MKVRNFHDSFSGIDGNLIVLAETTRVVEPTESSLNNPPPRELFPLVRLDFLRNVNAYGQDFIDIQNKGTPVAYIGTESFNRWIPLISKQSGFHGPGIRIISGGSDYHNDGKKGMKNPRMMGEKGVSWEYFLGNPYLRALLPEPDPSWDEYARLVTGVTTL